MIVVDYGNELREAFNAGKSAGMAMCLSKRRGGEFFAKTPLTYEEWLDSIKDRPAIVRG